MKAQRINEFTPEHVYTDNYTGDNWLHVRLTVGDYAEYKLHPEIVEYDNTRYYKMSFDSDRWIVAYREAGERLYHERYAI